MAITVKHTKVSTIPDGDDSSLIRPSDWNDDHQLTGTVPVANGGTGASTLTGYVKGNGTSTMTASSTIPSTDVTGLGTMSTQNANAIAVTGGSMNGVTISDYVATAQKGVANGVATLDGSGTVPVSQLPAAVLGALSYQGTWNATTNTPTLTSSVGTKGYYYVVNVAGSTNLNGITDWQVGDWAVYNGTAWQKIDNTDAVTSVNGYTGTVVLTQTDISGTVPTNRTITSGTGLSGGGDLSANRTLSISNTGVTATTYGSASSVPVVAVNAQGQVTSATNTAIAIANTQVSGLGTMSTQNANNVAITGGSLNGVAIGGTTAGDGTFDILTANVSRLGTSTATSYIASNGLSSTSTFTGSAPTDGIVVDYSTGYGRFSAFTNDGYQWYTGGIGTTKIMDITSAGALTTTGTVTANGVLLTGNLGTVTSVSGTTGRITSTGGTTPVIDLALGVATAGTTGSSTLIPVVTIDTYGRVTGITTASNPQGTVTSVTGTAPVVSSGGATPAISMAAATTSVNGYLTSTDWNTFNGKAPAVTYTTNYIPFGQGTTTPNQSANLQWDGSTLRAGSNALLGGTTNPIAGFTGNTNNYIQGYMYNANNGTSASSDFVAYTNNSTDAHGWADMGFTSQSYADTTYTVTGPNEAYLFGSAPSGSGKTGNLVYATDSTGTENVHQFYVGGFTQAKTAWKAKIDSTGLKATQVNATNGIIANSKTISASYTIASGDNAMSTGPVTVATGQSVTISSGSRWVVL